MRNPSKQTIRIFFEQTKKYKLLFFTIVFSIIANNLAGLIVPLYYKKFFDVLAETGEVSSRVPLLMSLLWMIALWSGISFVLQRIGDFCNTAFQTRGMRDLMNRCYGYILKHSFSFFHDSFVGSLVSQVQRFHWAYENILDRLFWGFLTVFVNYLGILFILGRESLWLSLVIFVWSIFFIGGNYYFSIYKLKFDRTRNDLDSDISGHLSDTLSNPLTVKLFNGVEKEKKSFLDLTARWQKITQFCWNLSNVSGMFQGFLAIVLEIAIMYIAILQWQKGVFTVGHFLLIQAYIMQILNHLWGFGRNIRDVFEQLSNAEPMAKILHISHEIQDSPTAKVLHVTEGSIRFENVSFYYHKTRPILNNFSLEIKAHEKIALVGPSGAGKSTVVKLLMRMYEVGKGKIYIDDQKIHTVTQESLWKQMSFVPQEPLLFHRSLRDNIAYGKVDATEEEVIAAAKKAFCHEFILELPDAYDTLVGERGVKLSGGERQRIALARAILRNTPILLLDEATSSLDSESERLIQVALERLMEEKTVIVIAHRLSTIMKMDRIVVMDQGQIVEIGSHTELLKKKKSVYKNLWNLQAGGFLQE